MDGIWRGFKVNKRQLFKRACYWSSSLYNSNTAYFAYFSNGFIDNNIIIVDYSIRLATTI